MCSNSTTRPKRSLSDKRKKYNIKLVHTMKKLILTIAIVLGLATVSFGQSVFGKGSFEEPTREGAMMKFPGHGSDDDFDADGPLGSGIAVLVGLGAAYAMTKKRKE